MVLSKCAICDSKKSRFIKNQEAKGLLSNLGMKTPLSKVPIFKDNTWGADFADMQLISKFNKGFRFYCVLLIFLVNMLELFL